MLAIFFSPSYGCEGVKFILRRQLCESGFFQNCGTFNTNQNKKSSKPPFWELLDSMLDIRLMSQFKPLFPLHSLKLIVVQKKIMHHFWADATMFLRKYLFYYKMLKNHSQKWLRNTHFFSPIAPQMAQKEDFF